MARLNASWNNFTNRGQTWYHFWQDSGTNYTLQVTSGSLAETGVPDNFLYSRVISCNTSAYLELGAEASVKKDSILISELQTTVIQFFGNNAVLSKLTYHPPVYVPILAYKSNESARRIIEGQSLSRETIFNGELDRSIVCADTEKIVRGLVNVDRQGVDSLVERVYKTDGASRRMV